MRTRLLALILAVVTALTLLVPAALAEDNEPGADAGYYYVYTENGKPLRVRSTPGGEVVGYLKYGTRIYCYYKDGGNGWALIDYTYDMPGVGKGTYACFVSSRFLVKNKPAARSSSTSSASAASTAAATAAAASAESEEALNAEFRSAKKVEEPYTVYARPTRVSGWVYLRWTPSKNSEIMGTYKANTAFTVLQELDNWLQVEEGESGQIGFVDRNFVSE